MKKIWPGVACSAVLLSGCMYGSATAPIMSLNPNSNQYQNQYQPNTPNNQYPQPQVPVGRVQVAQGQTIALTQTRVPPPRAAVAVAVPQPVRPQPVQPQPVQPQQGIVVSAPSPYQPATVQPTRPRQAAGNDDGWSVAPQSARVQASANIAAANTGQNQQPVRPSDPQPSNNNTVTASTTNTDNTATAQSSSENRQVAGATPPQQPAAPAKEETAVSVLLKKASASLGKGDLDGAAAYLENAQRIEPQNAKILYDIANIRYHQGRYKDAETFAGRAVQVGGGNAMMKKSWALVANARKSLGDNQGAIAAAEKAASFGN